MVTKNLENPTTIKQKKGRPSGYHRKSPLENADPAKRERMAEYLRLRTLIHGWAKRVQTCDIPELIEIAKDTLELHAKMRKEEPLVLMIFKEDFKHIEDVAAARLRNEKGHLNQP
jgi:hypothetical protein